MLGMECALVMTGALRREPLELLVLLLLVERRWLRE